MPRSFFDVTDNGNETIDGEGCLLPNMRAVRDEAIRALPQIAAEELLDGPATHVQRAHAGRRGTECLRSQLQAEIEVAAPLGLLPSALAAVIANSDYCFVAGAGLICFLRYDLRR